MKLTPLAAVSLSLLTLTTVTIVTAPPLFAHALKTDNDPLVDSVANGAGKINFNTGTIKATGHGAPPALGVATSTAQAKLMALGAAKADALRNLAMSVSAVQVTSETTVKNYVLQKDTVKTELSALLQSPRIVSEKMELDGTATVVVELPLYGENSVASVVLPEVLKDVDEAPREEVRPRRKRRNHTDNDRYDTAPTVVAPSLPAGGAGADENGNFVGPPEPAVRITPAAPPRVPHYTGREPGLTPLSDDGPFTSIIIDCRGLNVEAVMSPKLYDTTGREVYGTVRVSRDYAIDTGIVGYPRSMGEAIRTARCGTHPLIVKGLRVADRHRFNPVISLEDADRILAANNRDHFLEQTRVILLVDPVKYR